MLEFLIRTTWLDREAARQDVKVTDAEAAKSLDALKKKQFGSEALYRRFLIASGLANADIVYQQRASMLGEKLVARVRDAAPPATDAQIASYYKQHKSEFGVPEQRSLRVVLATTKARAEQARAALASGRSWNSVVDRYSVQPGARQTKGIIRNTAKGVQEYALDAAAFGAKKGELGGPVKGKFGWYVFEATAIRPGTQQSLDAARLAIARTLSAQVQKDAVTRFDTRLQKRWKAVTACRAGYEVTLCDGEADRPVETSQAPPDEQQGGLSP